MTATKRAAYSLEPAPVLKVSEQTKCQPKYIFFLRPDFVQNKCPSYKLAAPRRTTAPLHGGAPRSLRTSGIEIGEQSACDRGVKTTIQNKKTFWTFSIHCLRWAQYSRFK
jgi:hypothetical protein